MVEVFKTNVDDTLQAQMLVNQIHLQFKDYAANFDLEDCDKILRIESLNGAIPASPLIQLLTRFGFEAVVLSESIGEQTN